MRSRVFCLAIVVAGCIALAVSLKAQKRSEEGASGNRHTPVVRRSVGDCYRLPDMAWHTVRMFWYTPRKKLYIVAWEFCSDDIGGQRIRVSDEQLKTTVLEYRDDEILRAETVDLLGNNVPQLLVITGSAGTSDAIHWHVISESNGKLQEWRTPSYDAEAEKLLRTDEDFCCKDWNFHLETKDVTLARGIYRKGEANCCPSRGGVLVRLSPIDYGFKLERIERISKSECDRWRSLPFCLHCILTGGP